MDTFRQWMPLHIGSWAILTNPQESLMAFLFFDMFQAQFTYFLLQKWNQSLL